MFFEPNLNCKDVSTDVEFVFVAFKRKTEFVVVVVIKIAKHKIKNLNIFFFYLSKIFFT
jgi:predicted transport protein